MSADFVIINADTEDVGAQFLFASGSWKELGEILSSFASSYFEPPCLNVLSGEALERFTEDFPKEAYEVHTMQDRAKFLAALHAEFVARNRKCFSLHLNGHKLYVEAPDQLMVSSALVDIGAVGWELKPLSMSMAPSAPDATLPKELELFRTMVQQRMHQPPAMFVLLGGNLETGYKAYGPVTEDWIRQSERTLVGFNLLKLHPTPL